MAREPPLKENLLELVSSLNLLEKNLGVSGVNALSQHILWGKGYIEGYSIRDWY